jgi:hypothetical protein
LAAATSAARRLRDTIDHHLHLAVVPAERLLAERGVLAAAADDPEHELLGADAGRPALLVDRRRRQPRQHVREPEVAARPPLRGVLVGVPRLSAELRDVLGPQGRIRRDLVGHRGPEPALHRRRGIGVVVQRDHARTVAGLERGAQRLQQLHRVVPRDRGRRAAGTRVG